MNTTVFSRKNEPSLPNEKRFWLVIIPLLFVFGTLLGWYLGALRTAPRDTETSAGAATKKSNLPGAGEGISSKDGKQIDGAQVPRDGGNVALISGAAQALLDALQIRDRTDRAIRLREIARGLSAAEIPGVIEKARKSGRKSVEDILEALGSRWAELDPRAAADFGLKLPSDDAALFLQGVIQRWVTLQPAEASSWVLGLPPGWTRETVTDLLIYSLSRSNPAAAANLVRTGAFPAAKTGFIFSGWAERDPQAAVAAAMQLPGDSQATALRIIAGSWVKGDPQAAIAWVENMTDISTKGMIMTAMVIPFSQADPEGAIAWARTLSDDSLRGSVFKQAFGQMAGKSADGIRAMISGLPEGDRPSAADGAIWGMAMVRGDIRAGVSLLDLVPDGEDRNFQAGRLATIWAQTDPRAALDWLTKNVPANDGDALRKALGSWVTTAPQDAIAWCQALPQGPSRDSAMASLVSNLSESDLPRARSLFGELTPDAQASSVSDFAEHFWHQDEKGARDWAESLAPGKAQNQAMMKLASSWAEESPAKTAEWLGTLPLGPARDAAIIGFAPLALSHDPEGTMAWVVTISDAIDRENDIENAVRNWMRSDPAAAQAWVQNCPQVTPELRNQILTRQKAGL